jgi:hypothetical protein
MLGNDFSIYIGFYIVPKTFVLYIAFYTESYNAYIQWRSRGGGEFKLKPFPSFSYFNEYLKLLEITILCRGDGMKTCF